MNLCDLSFDGELAALLGEQVRGFHQLALVDLAFRLGRIEQRRRRQRERPLLPLCGRLGFLGQRQRGRRVRPSSARRRAATAVAVAPPAIGLDRSDGTRGRFVTAASAGARPGLRSGDDRLGVLGDDFAPGLSLRLRSIHARSQPMPRADRFCEFAVAVANIRPNENCVDRITASIISVSRMMSEPVRFR